MTKYSTFNKCYVFLFQGLQLFPITFNDLPTVNRSACRVDPPTGIADNTTFSVQCDDGAFKDEDTPLTYSLSFYIEPTTDTSVKGTTLLGPCK